MAKIAFIFSEHDLATIKHKSLKLFPLTNKLKAYLTANKLKYKNYEDYFPKNLSKKINRYAGKWATYSQFPNNLSLSLHNYFAKKLFQLTAIDNIIKTEQPTEVFLGKKEFSYKDILASDFEDITEMIKLVCGKCEVSLIDQSRKNIWLLKYFVQLLLLPKLRAFKIKSSFKSNIIFAAHHYHIINIIPLLLFLRQSQFKPLVVGRLGEAAKTLKKNNIEHISFYGEISFKDLPRYLIIKLKLLLSLYKFLRGEKSFGYYGYNLWNILKPKLISLFLSDALNLYSHKIFYNKLLYRVQSPQVVTVTNDFANQTLVNLAKTMNIPTMEIQHGITSGYDGVYLKADKFIVWGKIPKKIYVKCGVSVNKMIVTGWPGYEVYSGTSYRDSRINTKSVTITFLAQDPEGMSLLFMDRTPQENLEIFFKAISMLNLKSKIMVRLHPRADKSLPFMVAKKYNIDFTPSGDEKLINLLLQTDIVVGQTTSATLDAIIMHKPVIYLSSMRFQAKFVEDSGAVFEAEDSKDIEKYINLIIKNGMSTQMLNSQEKFLRDYCNFSKNSLVEITKVIRSMTKQ